MKPYQLEGLNWMIRLHDSGVNGILADEMGLGKTLQSISLLACLREARGIEGPHLIIVPKSTVGNWMRELKRWCLSINAFQLMGIKDERAVQRQTVVKQNFDALALSYEVAIVEKRPFCRRSSGGTCSLTKLIESRIRTQSSRVSCASLKSSTDF